VLVAYASYRRTLNLTCAIPLRDQLLTLRHCEFLVSLSRLVKDDQPRRSGSPGPLRVTTAEANPPPRFGSARG
jgi:hypothetical protein